MVKKLVVDDIYILKGSGLPEYTEPFNLKEFIKIEKLKLTRNISKFLPKKIKFILKNFMQTIKKIINFISKPKENYPNLLILKYHILKAIDKIKNKNKNDSIKDMFNWKLYTLHYKGELKELEKNNTINIKNDDFSFKENKLIKINSQAKPLHENWRLLYETILQLMPDSVFELGCGNAMHLNNVQILNPNIKLSAIDLSEHQIKYLRESYPNLKAEIRQYDATIPFPENFLPKTDISFTQAVIQHIYKDNKHLEALTNLFNISNKYIILIERWKNHHFMNDIIKLQQDGKIKWDNINFYYKKSKTTGKPHIMICSKEKLNYPVLNDYNILNIKKNDQS